MPDASRHGEEGVGGIHGGRGRGLEGEGMSRGMQQQQMLLHTNTAQSL